MTEEIDFSMSTLSINSTGSQNKDWDSSLESRLLGYSTSAATPRNSIAFPVNDDATSGRPTADAGVWTGSPIAQGKRSLSELMRLHSEKGTNCKLSQEEASRVADVLGQWINASSSPYESEDDFFSRSSQDDLSIISKRSPAMEARPRGQSESAGSRHPGSIDFVKS